MTPKTQKMMPYLIEYNWLSSYQTIEGIERILAKMDTRMKYESNMRFSINELHLFYADFEQEFTLFFEELMAHSNQKIQIL